MNPPILKKSSYSINIFFLGALATLGLISSYPYFKSHYTPPVAATTHSESDLKNQFFHLPLMFESNIGQTASEVKFLARTGKYMMYFTPQAMVFDFRQSASSGEKIGKFRDLPPIEASNSVLQLQFVGANQHPVVVGQEALKTKTNYFIGNDPKKWRKDISNYATVNYKNLYPGIDMVFYGKENKLEYDINVAPGVDPKLAKFKFAGAKKLTVDKQGNLIIAASAKEHLFMHKPVVYQMIDGKKKSINGAFVLAANNQVSFKVGHYDKSKTLVIDPVLSYSTYLGGSEDNCGLGIAIDTTSNPGVFVTGFTKSADFPIKGGVQSTHTGPGRNVFVTKIEADGTGLDYSTFLGGSGGNDEGFSVAADRVSAAYITGETNSKDFPLQNPYQATNSAKDFTGFVAKLNPEGNQLEYSTYLGGTGDNQEGNSIAVDQQGFAYVTGETTSTDFPVKNAFQLTNKGPKFTAYLTKLNTTGTDLIFSTYLGGSGGQDEGNGVVVDDDGNIFVTGETNSKDFPIHDAIQATPGPKGAGQTGFITRFTPDGASLVFSTYFGGSGGNDYPTSIALQPRGSVTIGGYTNSTDFPLKNAFQTTNKGAGSGRGFNGFVSRITFEGSGIVFSTYIGGSGGNDRVNSLKVNRLAQCHVLGQTNSTDFPVLNAVQSTNNGPNTTAFGTRINPDGSLLSSSYFGGSGGLDVGFAIAVDENLNSYATGITNSTDFPLLHALQSSHPATYMAWIAKVAP